MSTGHSDRAEDRAERALNQENLEPEWRAIYVAVAQVHATLAVAEAVERLATRPAHADAPEATVSHRDEDPRYPVADWRYEVTNGDTALGYWEWVGRRKDAGG